jgi:ribosome biogenesis GTPase / thiamine phosphate phosphatase
MLTLDALGWTPARERELAALGQPDLIPVRVAAVHRSTVELVSPTRAWTIDNARREPLAVGDWVALESATEIIVQRLSRSTTLVRQAAGRATTAQVLAANVDLALLVTALGGDLAPRRLERFQALCHAGGVRPVVVLNKIDLDPVGLGRHIGIAEAAAPGIPVVTTTTQWDGGVDELLPWLEPGRTLVMLGSSGVGKSSLLNVLQGREVEATRAVRERDGRGQHTTTARHLHPLADGRGLIIDTPGIREVALWSDEGLDATFSEIAALLDRCAFRDCRHVDEPGCAVLEAVASGDIDPGRVESWRTLQAEVAARKALRDPRARRRAGRRMAQMVKEAKDEKRRRGR